MKRFLLNKLFGNQPARQYLTLSSFDNDITEKVFLQHENRWLDVSKHQFVLCQVPFIIGIWLEGPSAPPSSQTFLKVTDRSLNDLVKIRLHLLDVTRLTNGDLLLFKVMHSNYRLISWTHQKLLLCYFYWQRKNKVTFKELDGFCSTYLYPRKVILTCFEDRDHYNLFPMDLQGYIEEENVYVLGLRNTNITLAKILRAGKAVVCDVSSQEKERLFALGRHHSSQPPKTLPFTFEKTEIFKIPVPDIANSYCELEIFRSINLGSHTLMIGKIVNKKLRGQALPSLYHLHITYAIRRQVNYTVL